MTDVEGLGGTFEAIERLKALRKQLNATEVTATYETKDGELEILVDEWGFAMYVDGQPVPLKDMQR